MSEEIPYEQMYLTLRGYDKALMKYYNKKNISDSAYFHCGLLSDIVSNTISILINLLKDNKQSMGVDLSSRAILEAIAVLNMDAKGCIKPINKKLYRILYTQIEYNCLTRYKKDPSIKNQIRYTENDFEQFYDVATECFNCTKEEIKQSKIFNNPYCYLATNLKDDISIIKILNNNDISIDDGSGAYSYFSCMVHPRCECDEQFENANYQLRGSYIDSILNMAMDYLKDKIVIDEPFTQTVDEVFKSRPDLELTIKGFESAMDDIEKAAGRECGYFIPFFYRKMKYLIKDMLLNMFLGFYEMVINKAKTFIEMFAVYLSLYTNRTFGDIDDITDCFIASSRLSLAEFYKKSLHGYFPYDEFVKNLKEDIEPIFTRYYKRKYKVTDFNKFFHQLSINPLYPFKEQKRNFTSFVVGSYSEYLKSDKDYEDVMTLYSLSLAMDHSSGYNFNQSNGLSNYFACEAISICAHEVYCLTHHVQTMLKNLKVQTSVNFESACKCFDNIDHNFQKMEAKIIMDWSKVKIKEPEPDA